MRVDALVATVMSSFAPPPDLVVSQWAEAHRRLPASSAVKGARWSNDTAPYLIEIMDAACDPVVRRLVIMGASQTGKSEAIHNTVGYFIEHDPSTVLWVMPSFEDAKRRSRGALSDLIRSTPSLKAVVRGRRAPRGVQESESTMLEKVYPGGSLILAGSGTPNTFAGVSALRVIADDYERFARLDEGSPDVLLTNRTASFDNGLVVFISSPLLVDGLIHTQFKTTDQRRLHVPCLSCRFESWITWQDAKHFHVVYEGKDPRTARVMCPSCESRFDEPSRRRMVAAAWWRPTSEADPSARGYHVPVMISTLGDATLSRMTQKWLEARASGPAALMSFVTTNLAEPWEDRGARMEPQALMSRLESYGDDVDVPENAVGLTGAVDVQIDRMFVGVYGWGVGAECWVVDWREIPGDPLHPETQTALLSMLAETYRHVSGLRLPILLTAIDSGYLPDRVAYTLAAKRPRRIVAVKGIGGRFGEPSILKYDPRKPPALLNVDGLKLETALGLEMAVPGPGYLHLSRRVCDEVYLAGLVAEHRETKRRNGVATMVWVQDRPTNHPQDCAGYGRAALKLLARMAGARSEIALLDKLEKVQSEAIRTMQPVGGEPLAPPAALPPKKEPWLGHRHRPGGWLKGGR